MQLTIKEMQDLETEMIKEVHEICERHDIEYFLAYGSALGAVRHGGPIPWDPDADIVVPYHQFPDFVKKVREKLPDKFYLDYYDFNKDYPYLFPRVGLKNYSSEKLHVDIFIIIGAPTDLGECIKLQKKLNFYSQLQYFRKRNENYFNYLTPKRKINTLIIRLLTIFLTTKRIIKIFDSICKSHSYETSDFIINSSGGYGEKEILKKSLYGRGAHISYNGSKFKIPQKYKKYLCHFYSDYNKLPPKIQRHTKDLYTIKKL